eukprot:500112-Pyramimonas_sp.AAC.1
MQYISKVSNFRTSRCAYKWKVRKGRKVRDGTDRWIAPGTWAFHGHRSLRCGNVLRDGAAAKSEITRKRGSLEEAMGHCPP